MIIKPAARIDELLATLCMHCGQNMIRPSATRGFLEHLLSVFFIRRFRCRGCMKRVFRFSPPWDKLRKEQAQHPSRYESARKARRIAA